jgi:hypothetical protein
MQTGADSGETWSTGNAGIDSFFAFDHKAL